MFVSLLLAAAVFLLGLPLLAGTAVYPVAIVDGNSMYPSLHNGDLVFFSSAPGQVRNGTIIVFVQGQSGVSSLDSLLKPVVIHRVIGIGQEPNGVAYYQTQGDNNQAPDPFVTDSPSVLGVPALVVPYAGVPVQFLKTPYGLVSLSALVSLYYLSGVETRLVDEKEKKRLVSVFAGHALNGEIAPSQFERLKLAVEFSEELPIELRSDPAMISMIDWLKGGGLSREWSEGRSSCPDCGGEALRIESGKRYFLVCARCSGSARGS